MPTMTSSIAPASVFKCLSDETRARAVLLLHRHGELCVCELMAALEQPQPKISRHLALLRNAGLIEDRRQGQWIYYRLGPANPAWIPSMLAVVLSANSDWLAQDELRLNHMSNRPTRAAGCG